jgi:hypothetical protein
LVLIFVSVCNGIGIGIGMQWYWTYWSAKVLVLLLAMHIVIGFGMVLLGRHNVMVLDLGKVITLKGGKSQEVKKYIFKLT